jgi:hypothetical protein
MPAGKSLFRPTMSDIYGRGLVYPFLMDKLKALWTKFQSLKMWQKAVIIFLLFGLISAPFNSGSSNNTNTATDVSPAIKTCQSASEEDLLNINAGMINSKYEVESGFIAEFSAEDVEVIKQIFPSYANPKVFAANIPGKEGESVIGLWGIQKFDYGWRITALNKQTMEYSNLGADVTESSATGRVNAAMLELSVNTNVISCLQS